MEDLRAYFREGLIVRIKALEAARRAVENEDLSAVGTIRRIARSLQGAAGTFGFPEVTQAAAAVVQASPEALMQLLEGLLDTLRWVAVTEDAPRSSVLIIEDEPVTARTLERALGGRGRELVFCMHRERAERILERGEVSLVLLDLCLPGHDGRDLLVWIRSRPTTRRIPVFVMSAHTSSVIRTECFALGADEFFSKPLDIDALSAAVGSKLQRFAELLHDNRTDPLTQLPNKTAFEDEFSRARLAIRRSGATLSLGAIKVDDFAAIIDVYGHGESDQVLRRTATVLKTSLRGTDIVARWKGERFVALFPDASPAGATIALQNVLARLRVSPFRAADGRMFSVTFSAGVTRIVNDSPLDDSVSRAQSLANLARLSGGAQVCCDEERSAPPRKKVVVAEDDEFLAALIGRLLLEEDVEVVHCGDGAEALKVALEVRASLVILDSDTPGLDRTMLREAARRAADVKTVPLVLLTTRTDDDDIVDVFELGADDCVIKPFSPSDLRTRIRKYLRPAPIATTH